MGGGSRPLPQLLSGNPKGRGQIRQCTLRLKLCPQGTEADAAVSIKDSSTRKTGTASHLSTPEGWGSSRGAVGVTPASL